MCEVDGVIKLLLTVSGGLEDLTQNQIQCNFRDVLLDHAWSKRTSGSQLYLILRRNEHVANVIADAMQKLDFVEYVFILVDSFNIDEVKVESGENRASRVLALINESTSKIPMGSIDFCKTVCDLVEGQSSSDVDVGLGGLPGVFLPAPHVQVSHEDTDNNANADCQSFSVNTIYTQKSVAKAVIEGATKFIQQYYKDYVEGKDLWVDAGSGDGSLLEHLPPQRSIGVDTHPKSPKVQCMDYLKLSKERLMQKYPEHEHVYVISNPPFSVSSRGDYSPIVKFINHSFDELEAKFVAVICPSKFARERIWASLGMTAQAHLWGRFFLPQNSFYEPSTGKPVHIHSLCLIFGNHTMQTHLLDNTQTIQKSGCYVSAKRDKGSFRSISTAELTASVVSGLRATGVELVAERQARYLLNAKLLESSFELWWQINPLGPCSSVNSNSAKIQHHSLGWISLSVKPAVALAMSSLALEKYSDRKQCFAVNLMSGEGTIELEASRAVDSPFFIISGDIRFDCALKSSQRIHLLKTSSSCNPLVDFIVWDAQNLPLRKGFADAVFGDLPIQGTLKKAHQQPIIGQAGDKTVVPSASLKYSLVLSESSRILRARGRAALTSVDYRSLGGATKKYNWSSLNHGASINLGGLTGKIFVMERNEPCTKDLCLTVPQGSSDYSSWLLKLASKAFENANEDNSERKTNQPVTQVQLLNSFCHPEEKYRRHCYRFTFHEDIRNAGSKLLEKEVRRVVEENLLEGMSI
jgi:hypothetical protein